MHRFDPGVQCGYCNEKFSFADFEKHDKDACLAEALRGSGYTEAQIAERFVADRAFRAARDTPEARARRLAAAHAGMARRKAMLDEE